MFSHILLPTDGSPLSQLAIDRGLTLAKENGAKVTVLNVIPVYHISALQSEALAYGAEQFEEENQQDARACLDRVAASANDHGVPCDTLCVNDDHPYEAIIRVATELQCDLITMASHGRKGVAGMLLGSQTHKVLTHSTIPVLVYR